MKNKKYFIASDTPLIKNHLNITNIRYSFKSEKLEGSPLCNLDYDVDFSKSFYQHIRFYEITLNEKEHPIRLHCLSGCEEDVSFPNGWIDFHDYLTNANYYYLFVRNSTNKSYYYDNNEELFRGILQWSKETAKYLVLNTIIDELEYGEY